jgi:hypothetical protein
MLTLKIQLLLALLVSTTLAISIELASVKHAYLKPAPIWKRIPIPPLSDPFYTPPSRYETTSPGTILRSRPIPNPIVASNSTNANIKAAFQVLYRTTDSLGEAQAAMQTVLIPHNADYSKYLSYQIAYDSAYDNCSPSYVLQQGA